MVNFNPAQHNLRMRDKTTGDPLQVSPIGAHIRWMINSKLYEGLFNEPLTTDFSDAAEVAALDTNKKTYDPATETIKRYENGVWVDTDFENTFYRPDYSGAGAINLTCDLMPERAMLLFNLDITGTGGANVIQDIEVDDVNGHLYTVHAFAGNALVEHIISRFDLNGPISQTPVDVGQSTNLIGHQGLTLVHDQTDPTNPWLWLGAGTSVTDQASKVCRFKYNVGAAPSNIEIFQLFQDGTGAGNTTPTISTDGRFLVAELETATDTANIVRVFLFKTLIDGGAGNYDGQQLYEWNMPASIIGPNHPVQQLYCDGSHVYIMTGDADISTPGFIAQFTICLLYTSPSPRDQRGSRMPSSA